MFVFFTYLDEGGGGRFARGGGGGGALPHVTLCVYLLQEYNYEVHLVIHLLIVRMLIFKKILYRYII